MGLGAHRLLDTGLDGGAWEPSLGEALDRLDGGLAVRGDSQLGEITGQEGLKNSFPFCIAYRGEGA